MTVRQDDLTRLLSLWDACEAAERHFHSCQSTHFRSFVKSVWNAPNMHETVERLKHPEVSAAGETQPKNSADTIGKADGSTEEAAKRRQNADRSETDQKS